MRIIAGTARGTPLRSPSEETRPTKDRVREAVFSILNCAVDWPEYHVLDLFAGTGAMGIEALSRGAADAVFVDESRHATRCVEQNLAAAKFEGTVRNADTFRALPQLSQASTRFNLIFADPPYEKETEDRNFARELLECDALSACATEGGFLVLEMASDTTVPESPRWELLDQRKYGSTFIHFYRLKN